VQREPEIRAGGPANRHPDYTLLCDEPPLAVDAGGVQAASGKAAGPADTGVVSAGPVNPAGRRLCVVRRRQAVGRPALDE